jgi:hypothetical protein
MKLLPWRMALLGFFGETRRSIRAIHLRRMVFQPS